MKNAVFWDATQCKNQRFGGTITSIIGTKRLSELGTRLAVTSN
jgi:hypothetical protein